MGFSEIIEQYNQKKIDKHTFRNEMFKTHKILNDYPLLIKNSIINNILIDERKIVLVTRNGIRFYLDFDEISSTAFDILNLGDIENKERSVMLSLIKDGDTIFDIGANFGWYSLIYSRSFPNAKIHAFEPIGTVHNLLNNNIKLNEYKNINTYNFGFWKETDILKFHFYKQNIGASSISCLLGEDDVELIECPLVKLDDFVHENKITNIDFIKCDVEGSELFVYQGGIDSIERFKPIIFSEMLRKWAKKFDYHPNDIIKLLKNSGYFCYEISDCSISLIDAVTEDTIGTNFIFLNSYRHGDIIRHYEESCKI